MHPRDHIPDALLAKAIGERSYCMNLCAAGTKQGDDFVFANLFTALDTRQHVGDGT
jgi:hypothetical protein